MIDRFRMLAGMNHGYDYGIADQSLMLALLDPYADVLVGTGQDRL